MAYKRAFDEYFIDGAVKTVARNGLENTRTKDVAEYAGFSEATMFRRFPTKDDLMRETFLYIDKKISSILLQSDLIKNPGSASFEEGVHKVWRKVYRYLINHSDETVFLIRYRYSSLYTNEVRNMRQAYNGAFEKAYAVFENQYGENRHSYRGFLINYIFEMTLCFAEKIVSGKVTDDAETEKRLWLIISSSVKALLGDTAANGVKSAVMNEKNAAGSM